ncbi:MAG: hypothetical protein HRT72_13535 [Flavobacteriales bacterium]|nr:hypothetical protein [Flavobacteriales bacterium]
MKTLLVTSVVVLCVLFVFEIQAKTHFEIQDYNELSTASNGSPEVLKLAKNGIRNEINISSSWEGILFDLELTDSEGNVIIQDKMMTFMDSEYILSTTLLPKGEYNISLSYDNEIVQEKTFSK